MKGDLRQIREQPNKAAAAFGEDWIARAEAAGIPRHDEFVRWPRFAWIRNWEKICDCQTLQRQVDLPPCDAGGGPELLP